MNRKQLDRMYKGVKLDDKQLAKVTGGLQTPLSRPSTTLVAPKLNTIGVRGHSPYHK